MQQRSRLVTATAVPWPFYETRKSCLEKVLFQAFFNFCKGQLHLCRSPEWKKYQDVGRKGLFTHRLFHKRAKAFWRIIYQIFNEEAAQVGGLVNVRWTSGAGERRCAFAHRQHRHWILLPMPLMGLLFLSLIKIKFWPYKSQGCILVFLSILLLLLLHNLFLDSEPWLLSSLILKTFNFDKEEDLVAVGGISKKIA